MSNNRFVQLHLLISYPPSNPNRDQLGQPKTAVMGGTQRSRISSQSLKRAWRNSEIWKKKGLAIGTRTRELFLSKEHGELYLKLLNKHGDKAEEYTKAILSMFAKTAKVKEKPEVPTDKRYIRKEIVTEQPIHFSDTEITKIKSLVDRLDKKPTDEELNNLLDENPRNIDLAMFGRMIAKRPDANEEAAVQVAHAISINEVEIEDDFFTAVDDLNKHGSAHVGEQEFVSAIYYLYVCVDRDLLIKNIGDETKANDAMKVLLSAAATVAPSGKQNSYANRAQAFYILTEKGDTQPRNLSLAFIKAMPADDPKKAIAALKSLKSKFDKAYDTKNTEKEMDIFKDNKDDKDNTLKDLLNFIGG